MRMIVSLALGAIVALSAPAALAKATHESPYSFQQTFGSALRLLKVDLGLAVLEKDSEWGYVLFEYTSSESGDRKNQGSFTFVKIEERIQVSLQIPAMPSYHEQVIIQKLERKLAEEHGEPPAPPEKAPKKDREKDGDKEPSEPPADAPKEGAPS